MKLYLPGTPRMRTLSFALLITFSLPPLVLAQERSPYTPDPKLTPGDTLKVSKEDLCGPGSKTLDSSIPISLKIKVFDLYRIRGDSPTSYNVDHLIPVSLGGSNSIKNLWPQPLSGEWNYLKKNKLEHRLHKLVCRGELALETAQQEISTDWVSAYKKYLGNNGRVRSKRLIERFTIRQSKLNTSVLSARNAGDSRGSSRMCWISHASSRAKSNMISSQLISLLSLKKPSISCRLTPKKSKSA